MEGGRTNEENGGLVEPALVLEHRNLPEEL